MRARAAGRARGSHVIEIADLLGGGAGDNREAVPQQQSEREHDDRERAADQRHHGERDQDERYREPAGDDERDDVVDPAAEKSTDHAQRRADQPGHDDGREPDQQGDARPEHQAGEIVAAHLIGAEYVLARAAIHPHRRHGAPQQILGKRIVRHQRRADERGERHDADDQCADHEAGMPQTGRQRDRHPRHDLVGRAHAVRSRGSRKALSRSAKSVSIT